MLTCVGTGTGAVRTSNVPPAPPAGMKTVGGSVIRSGLLFTSVTSTPPGGAGFNNVAVPSAEPPPTTASWSSAMPQRIGNRPSEFCCQAIPYAAWTVPTTAPDTGIVVIGETVASVLPAGTTTLVGTWAWGISVARLTSAPPGGAGMFSVTRAWVELPPSTLPGSVMMWKIASPGGVDANGATVKLCPADHGPRTSPCTARTRPKYVPGGKLVEPPTSGTGT